MAVRFTFIMFRFLILVLLIARSHQYLSDSKNEKLANCYKECQENFTKNSTNDESPDSQEIIPACHKGCRFFSLILHASNDFNPTTTYKAVKEGCMLSCGESYTNLDKVTSCNFGCRSLKSADSSDVFEHQPQKTRYAIIITEPDVFIYPGDSDPDEALIDPGLKKQIQKTLQSLLDPKPKIPEIHFRNLPISNEEMLEELPGTKLKCLKYCGFHTKFGCQSGRIKYLLFDIGLTILCFIFILLLDPMLKGFNQIFHFMVHNRPYKEEKETSTKQNLLVNVEYPEKPQLLEVKCEPTE